MYQYVHAIVEGNLKRSYILIGAILLASCGANESQTTDTSLTAIHGASCESSEDALRRAALDNLFPLLHYYNEYDVVIDRVDKISLDHEATKIRSLQLWANRLKDPCVRRAYEGWLGYYQGALQRAYSELKTHDIQQRQEKYDRKVDANLKSSQELAKMLPKPDL